MEEQEIFNRVNARFHEMQADYNFGRLSTSEGAEEFRIKWLGSKGHLKELFGHMPQISPERKKEFGLEMKKLKEFAEAKLEEAKANFNSGKSSSKEIPDLTAPGFNIPIGTRHPLSIVKNKMIDIFSRIGFMVAEGPEIEDDWHNFTALNTPQDHPARAMQRR